MTENNNETDGPPWYVKYRVWEKSDEANDSRRAGHTGERQTFEGHFGEPTKIECVNAILYEIRGTKSPYELAYIDEIHSIENTES